MWHMVYHSLRGATHMTDYRWNATDSFETACRKAPFSELIRLALIAAVAIRDRMHGGIGSERMGGIAGHAA